MATTSALPTHRVARATLRGISRRSASFRCSRPEEEYMLAKRWREHGDPDAAHKLVTSHLRLVAKIAMGYRGYGLPLSELISEGNVGMMQAVKRFDPDRGFRLATYAMWWIRAVDPGIHPAFLVAGEDGHHRGAEEAVLQPAQAQGPDPGDRGRRPVARERAEDRARARRARGRRRQHEPPPRQPRPFAQRAARAATARANGRTGWSTRPTTRRRAWPSGRSWALRRDLLRAAMAHLTERERDILVERRLRDEPTTLEDLSQQYGISRERVRQIEVRAFEKLQRAIKSAALERHLLPG